MKTTKDIPFLLGMVLMIAMLFLTSIVAVSTAGEQESGSRGTPVIYRPVYDGRGNTDGTTTNPEFAYDGETDDTSTKADIDVKEDNTGNYAESVKYKFDDTETTDEKQIKLHYIWSVTLQGSMTDAFATIQAYDGVNGEWIELRKVTENEGITSRILSIPASCLGPEDNLLGEGEVHIAFYAYAYGGPFGDYTYIDLYDVYIERTLEDEPPDDDTEDDTEDDDVTGNDDDTGDDDTVGDDTEDDTSGDDDQSDSSDTEQWEHLGLALKIIIPIVSGAVGVLGYFKLRRRKTKFQRLRGEVDNIYNNLSDGLDDAISSLDGIYSQLTHFLDKNKITDNQYIILEKRIKDYILKLRGSARMTNLQGALEDAPKSIKQKVKFILKDGKVTKDELDTLEEMFGEEEISDEKREEIEKYMGQWMKEDAGE